MNNVIFCCICICVTVLLIAALVFVYMFFKQECYCGLMTNGRRMSSIYNYIICVAERTARIENKVDKLSGDIYACKCMLDELSQYYPRLTKKDVERIIDGTA